MKNNQLRIILIGTTFTGIVILLNYFREKKKKKQDEERRNEYLKCTSLSDFEQLAKKLMKPHRFYYYNYKVGEGHTYEACRDYFNKHLRIMPRVLIDVTHISLKTTIFGSTYESPIIIAPTGAHGLAHIDGEIDTARGATEADCPKFLQIYLTLPTEILEKVILQADQNGYRAIVVTCDHASNRTPDHILPLFEASKSIDPTLIKDNSYANLNFPDAIRNQIARTGSVTWANIEWLKKLTKLPIICKGILSPIDAELAIKYGANGIIVSNHGSRQIDTAPPAIECLEDIINVVNGRAEVFVDSGIRTGTDVLKALALGARAVFVGRPILYGLAYGGYDGVRKVLDILKRELTYDMACCGLTSIDQINKDILYKQA